MKIGLIDIDGGSFPNLALMKLSSWHKTHGDTVQWYTPWDGMYDKVYCSKVFSFTDDYEHYINAEQVVKGGSGYNIKLVDGKEVYSKDKPLLYPIEHSYPDYSLYNITDTAYGFMTRGCPRGCDFCIVQKKEGKGETVAELREFWNGQKNIELLDPNFFAVKEWKQNAQQLINSKAYINFNQGVDVRAMTKEKAHYIKQMKIKYVHFAWDRYEDGDKVLPKIKMFRDITNWNRSKIQVYVLCGFDTSFEQDLERVYKLREAGVSPYVMLYDKTHIPKWHDLRRLQRYVNHRAIFNSVDRFEDYQNVSED